MQIPPLERMDVIKPGSANLESFLWIDLKANINSMVLPTTSRMGEWHKKHGRDNYHALYAACSLENPPITQNNDATDYQAFYTSPHSNDSEYLPKCRQRIRGARPRC